MPAASRARSEERQLDPAALGPASAQLEAYLRANVIGQHEAIRQIVVAWVMHSSGLHPAGRPVANLLFTGPTGVGKTLVVEVLAEALFGSRDAVLKIDCAEFQHSHEIARLVGAPPGYLGHRETPPLLTQEALDRHHTERLRLSLVLFDEIEKASDALWRLLLGVLDKATLTLGDARRVDFSRAMIFLTSNLGGGTIESMLQQRLGFAPADTVGVKGAGLQAVRRHFSPEFRNRLDAIVVFQPLDRAGLRQVLEIELDRTNRHIAARFSGAKSVQLTEEAKARLAESGYEPQFGARHLKRAIEQHIVQPVARLMDSGQVTGGGAIRVDWDAASESFQYFA